jgi:hypothetical protein
MVFLPRAEIAWTSTLDCEAEAKTRPGPDTRINNATLVGHAGEIYWLLASNWADIGWQLQHARKPDDIRAAFELLKDSNHRGFLTPFLRSTGEKATGTEVRNTSKALGEALTRHTEEERRYRDILERSQLAQTALSQAPPEKREVIALEANRREAELEEARKILETASKEVDSNEKKLRDQEAYYARAELCNFIRSKKYACNPRNLAFAMTGLPCISCFWSARRCQGQNPKLPEIREYEAFKFIRRVWERTTSTDEQTILDLFEAAVLGLPKSKYLRIYLAKNWRDLKQAICQGLKERCRPDIPSKRVPYVIASVFFKDTTKQKTALDQLLSEKEQLNLA